MKVKTYIGLGANLADPKKQITQALEMLSQLKNSKLALYSSLYLSPPMGPQDQDHYINAVAKIVTELSPIELLDELQLIEKEQGRVRKKEQWGPRTLDLDLLLYSDKIINEPRLTVPHYGMKERAFVLVPLAEIEPQLTLPDGSNISVLIEKIGHQGIKKL